MHMKKRNSVGLMRRSMKLTKAQLAKMAGVSASEIGEIEKGRRKPQPKTIRALADALGQDYGMLYEMFYGGDTQK